MCTDFFGCCDDRNSQIRGKEKNSQIDALLFNTGLKSRVAVPHTASPKAASGPPAARPTCAGGGQRPRPSRLPANTAGGAMSSCPLPRSGTARGAAAPAPPRPGLARLGPARPGRHSAPAMAGLWQGDVEKPPLLVKIVMAGESCVGKTSIVRRYTEPGSPPAGAPTSYLATIGE